MPSYRLELEIGDLRPGARPDEVMAAARSSLGHHVDATDVAVTNGTARVLIRFTVPASSAGEEDVAARLAVRDARDAVEQVATTGRAQLLRSYRGSWLTLG